MSVVSIGIERVNGADNTPYEISDDGEQYDLRLIALVNDALDGAHTIYQHSGCPKKGSTYAVNNTFNAQAICTNVRITPMGGRYADPTSGTSGTWKWLIEATYSTSPQTQESQPPGAGVAKVYFDSEQYDIAFDRDLDGNPVLNSAEMPYDPPMVKEDHRLIIRIEKAVPAFDALFADKVMGRVNSTPFFGYTTGTLRITKISATPQDNADFGQYYLLSVEMVYRRIEDVTNIDIIPATVGAPTNYEPHQALILDTGRYTLNPGTGKHVKILDEDDDHVIDPVKLDGDGQKLEDGADPVYIKYQMYPTYDFNLLGLYP
jgi:hypothetical protein